MNCFYHRVQSEFNLNSIIEFHYLYLAISDTSINAVVANSSMTVHLSRTYHKLDALLMLFLLQLLYISSTKDKFFVIKKRIIFCPTQGFSGACSEVWTIDVDGANLKELKIKNEK